MKDIINLHHAKEPCPSLLPLLDDPDTVHHSPRVIIEHHTEQI